METTELVEELESRGVSVNRCEIPDESFVPMTCKKPATRHVNGLYRCEECHVRIVRRELRAKFEVGSGDLQAKRMLVDAVHRGAMDGKEPEVLAQWVAVTAGLSWEELCEVEAEVITLRKMKLWIVWGSGGKRYYSSRKSLVLARSGPEAKKMLRDKLYKEKREMPDKFHVQAIEGVTEPQVISDNVEFHLEYILEMHGDTESAPEPTVGSLFENLFRGFPIKTS